MKKHILTSLVLVLGIANASLVVCQEKPGPASAAPAQQQKQALTNADVVGMVKGGLAESTIVLVIEQGPTQFDTSPTALLDLTREGVSQAVLDAMVKASSGRKEQPPKLRWLLILYLALIVVFPVGGHLYDMHKSYEERKWVLSPPETSAMTAEQRMDLLKALNLGPTGLTGFTRGAIAVTLILILGIAVFHLIVLPPDYVPDLAEKLLMLVAGTLTSIVGFYFGYKAASEASPQPPVQAQEAGMPTIDSVTVGSGPDNGKLIVRGKRFGEQEGKRSLTIEDKPIAVQARDWTDIEIKCDVPTHVHGDVKVVVTNDRGKRSNEYRLTLP